MWYMDGGVLGHPHINTYQWKKYMCPPPWLVGWGIAVRSWVGWYGFMSMGEKGELDYLSCSIGVSWGMLCHMCSS